MSSTNSAAEPIVLVDRGGALLSVVCARLIMAGDTPITAGNCDDPQLDRALRSKAILVVEGSSLATEPREAARRLRAKGWSGLLAIIVDAIPETEPPARVRWVPKNGGTPAIMSAIAALRTR